MTLSIVHLSDLHIDAPGGLAARVTDQLARWLAQNRPDSLVVITGDIIDGGDAAQLALAKSLLAPLDDGRLLVVPGNHDHGPLGNIHDDGAPARFRETFGIEGFPALRVVDDLLFVGIDSRSHGVARSAAGGPCWGDARRNRPTARGFAGPCHPQHCEPVHHMRGRLASRPRSTAGEMADAEPQRPRRRHRGGRSASRLRPTMASTNALLNLCSVLQKFSRVDEHGRRPRAVNTSTSTRLFSRNCARSGDRCAGAERRASWG